MYTERKGEIPGRQTSRGNLDNNLSIFQGTQIFNCSILNRKWLRDDKIKDLQQSLINAKAKLIFCKEGGKRLCMSGHVIESHVPFIPQQC